jgi:hypothetical protein
MTHTISLTVYRLLLKAKDNSREILALVHHLGELKPVFLLKLWLGWRNYRVALGAA